MPEMFFTEKINRLVERQGIYYPETNTAETTYRYRGLPSFPVFMLAVVLFVKRREHESLKRIYVNDKLIVCPLSFKELLLSLHRISETKAWFGCLFKFRKAVIKILNDAQRS